MLGSFIAGKDAIAAQIPEAEIGGNYFQETHPQELFRQCSVYFELVSIPAQLPRLLQIAMRAAVQRGGVAIVVVPGDVFLADAPSTEVTPVRAAHSVIRPDDAALSAAAEVLNAARAVTILAGAGCAGAHDQLMALAGALQAPVVHAFRGKEFAEYDNPHDVGMIGLIGFGSGDRAMEHCDALLMLGTDFPYRPFLPEGVPVVQVDVRGEQIGKLASPDAVFTADVGTPCIWAARYLRMNGARRLVGSFNHGSMANALPHATGAQASHPGRQVVALCGDGGLAILLGELITLRQRRLPVKVVVFNNGALSFVELEMKAAGIVTYGTDLDNPDFAGWPRAAGLSGTRVDKVGDLEDALREAFAHDGPALVDVATARQEISLPPKLTYGQLKGFTLYTTRTILSGGGEELIELSMTNLRELDVE